MGIDQKIVEWLNLHRIDSLDPFFILISDTTSFIAYSIPLTVLVVGFIRKRRLYKIYGLQLLSSILLSTVLVTSIKNVIKRQRPYELDKLIQKLSSGGGFSFPSGHTADAFVIAISVSLIINQRKWILIPLWIWAIVVAYSRMVLGVHYLTDIIGATVIALFSSFLMNFFFKSVKAKNVDL